MRAMFVLLERMLLGTKPTDPTLALSVTSVHIQTAPNGVPGRLPFGTGDLEVLRVDRVRKSQHRPSLQHPELSLARNFLLLEGMPASSRSKVDQALLAFVDPGIEPPLSHADPENGLLHLYFQMSDFERVSHLLGSGKRRLCYCWQAADRSRSVVMLMAMG